MVRRVFLLLSLAASAVSQPLPPPLAVLIPPVNAGSIHVVQSTEAGDKVSKKADVSMRPNAESGVPIIEVNISGKKQVVQGFGGAITDAVAHASLGSR